MGRWLFFILVAFTSAAFAAPRDDEFLAARDEPACFEPAMSDDERDELIEGWHRAVNAAVVWADHAAR